MGLCPARAAAVLGLLLREVGLGVLTGHPVGLRRGMTRSLARAYRILLGSIIWIWQVPITAMSTASGSARPRKPGTSNWPA